MVAGNFSDLLDHWRAGTTGRLLRLVYLLGGNDAGVELEDLSDWLESQDQRALWLRTRMRVRERATPAG